MTLTSLKFKRGGEEGSGLSVVALNPNFEDPRANTPGPAAYRDVGAGNETRDDSSVPIAMID